MNNLICWFKGHIYNVVINEDDFKKINSDHLSFDFGQKEKEIKKIIKDFFKNDPSTFCLRCHKLRPVKKD